MDFFSNLSAKTFNKMVWAKLIKFYSNNSDTGSDQNTTMNNEITINIDNIKGNFSSPAQNQEKDSEKDSFKSDSELDRDITLNELKMASSENQLISKNQRHMLQNHQAFP